jgi:hypothetical protein
MTHLQFIGQNLVAQIFTDSYFFSNFTDSFGESNEALSQRDRRPLTWKAVFDGRSARFEMLVPLVTLRTAKQSSP